MKPRQVRQLILVLVLSGAAVLAVQRLRTRLAAAQRRAETCEALAAGDVAGALATSETLEFRTPADLDTAVCRCRALGAAGQRERCADLLRQAWLFAGDDWLPTSDLVVLLVTSLADHGEAALAADLARRGAQAYPDSKALLFLEWQQRRALEPEQQVLADLESRLPADPAAWPEQRAMLAKAHSTAGRFEEAIRVLGSPPPADSPVGIQWYLELLDATAGTGDTAAVRQAADGWLERGAPPAVAHAGYVIALANHQLDGDDAPTLTLLREVVEQDSDGLDPTLRTAVHILYLFQLVEAGEYDRALALLDAAPPGTDFGGYSREQVLAARAGERFDPQQRQQGTLRFELPQIAVGGTLLVGPPHTMRPDLPMQALDIPASGVLEVERPAWYLPYHWVVRDPSGNTLASGSTWMSSDEVTTVEVTTAPPTHARSYTRQRRPADGRTRVWVLIQDCMDWRVARYLMARGEMPVLSMMLQDGYHTVIDSNPPVTALAVDLVMHPRRPKPPSMLELVHQLGAEMDAADLTASGGNPFAALSPFLPAKPRLESTIGAGDHAVANLLFSHGALDVGMNGEVFGPHGQPGAPLVLASSRTLDARELAQLPGAERYEADPHWAWVEEAAAVMDGVLNAARGEEIDLLLVRTAKLDTATHAHLNDIVGRQDDGASLLAAFYGYLDLRAGEVLDALDEDDYLIVMSDHSIKNAMEHDRPAMFVMVGPDVPVGAGSGAPHIAGVPRVLAALFGIETDWPDTGIAPWLTAPAE